MSARRIAHVAIAVNSLAERIPFYRDQLGMQLIGEEEVADQGVRVAMLQIGESTIELLEPLSPQSTVAKFIAKHGEGIHHIALQIDDLPAQLAQLADNGLQLIDKAPRPGAHGQQIAFVHPKSTGGVLLELCQHAKDPNGGIHSLLDETRP